MKLFLNNLILFLFIVFFSTTAISKDLVARYKIELGPLDLGTLDWKINIQNKAYKTSMFLRDRGLLSALYKFNGEYFSEGYLVNKIFISSKYKQHWQTKKKTKKVDIVFENKKVSSLSLHPKETEHSRVSYLEIENVNDPLASFLNVLLNDGGGLKTIDGRRLYTMFLTREGSEDNIIKKRITIRDYVNVWADHKRNDLKFILITHDLLKDSHFPKEIKIKNKGLVFLLTKI